MDSGEMGAGKFKLVYKYYITKYIIYISNIQLMKLSLGELKRLDMMLGKMKLSMGYWLISSDRNGGYAYAKVCSNGFLFT